jgi:hypothetical protein
VQPEKTERRRKRQNETGREGQRTSTDEEKNQITSEFREINCSGARQPLRRLK